VPTLDPHTCWIIGFGNNQRRDDGIGPFVVDRLKGPLERGKNTVLLALPQLRADLVEELQGADLILFVDATIDNLEGGRKWSKLYPEKKILPYLTHHVHPSYLLHLIQTLYHRSASGWLVSIQGNDFGFGEGLSPGAEKAAVKVISEIIQFIDKKGFIEEKSIEKDINTGVSHGECSRYPHY
jgi:hydrogenase maturation protease